MPTIRIESILGGQSPTTHYAARNQFRASLGIDPAQPIDDLDSALTTAASGVLRPSASQKISGTTLTSAPLWMVPNPKDGLTYIYDANGSAYSLNTSNSLVGLADGGTLSNALGNGAEYYDNYIYFAKNTDIARYGPLNGAPVFTGTYWTGTLAKAALSNTAYPNSFRNNILYPNHVLHRHSDGRLYIADVNGNQGTIHYIATTKGAVEGDTNNASTYGILTFGYGLWPIALEGYGANLVIALIEFSNTKKRDPRAKIAFWDTTSTNFNQITWVEYPDPLITALKNADGQLYVFSGNYNSRGFRVTRYVGGYSFKEVFYSETGEPPMPGAVDDLLHQILIGTYTTVPENDGCVYSLGLQKAALGSGTFNIMRSTGGTSSTSITCILPINAGVTTPLEMGFYNPTVGWTQAGDGSTGVSHGLDQQQTAYNNAPSVWWSQVYNVGQPFQIKRIRIPLAQAVAANMTVIPKLYVDDGTSSQALTTINNTNFPNSELVANIKTDGNGTKIISGKNNFWLELRWTGSALLTVNLPIIIDFEIIPD